MYFGLTGGFLFILIQLVLLVDLAHYLSETWVEKMEKASSPCASRCWYVRSKDIYFSIFQVSVNSSQHNILSDYKALVNIINNYHIICFP